MGAMRHHHCGAQRRFAHPDDLAERRLGGHHHRGRHGSHAEGHAERHGGGRGRTVDHGEMRLLVLALLAEQPRHGYELMKAVEERTGGAYSPSPGAIYPTLAALEDMGHAEAVADGNRRRYTITPAGEAQLAARRTGVDVVLARLAQGGRRGPPPGTPDGVLQGMDALKLALGERLRRGGLDESAEAALRAILVEAAAAVARL
jgi:DNA-binding PadR family transcriptional regulator